MSLLEKALFVVGATLSAASCTSNASTPPDAPSPMCEQVATELASRGCVHIMREDILRVCREEHAACWLAGIASVHDDTSCHDVVHNARLFEQCGDEEP